MLKFCIGSLIPSHGTGRTWAPSIQENQQVVPWPLLPPRKVYLVFSVFPSVLKLCLFLGADEVFTLGHVYAIDFLLLEASCLDHVESAECAGMMECGGHLAKVTMSSVRRPCVLACLKQQHICTCVYVFTVGPESLPPHTSVKLHFVW